MPATAVHLARAREIQAGLRAAPSVMKKELRRSHQRTAREVRGWTRSAAQGGTAQQRRMAGGIGSSANSTSASLAIRNTRGAPGAAGAFYGAKKYRQFPRWVGNTWPMFDRTRGPQPINRALADHERAIDDLFLEGQLQALARAFPGRGR